VQDNMIETPHGNDCRRKVPVFSLYSETREPTSDMLRHVDVLVIDLQDIGARIYTYIYTMANCMRAAARNGVKTELVVSVRGVIEVCVCSACHRLDVLSTAAKYLWDRTKSATTGASL